MSDISDIDGDTSRAEFQRILEENNCVIGVIDCNGKPVTDEDRRYDLLYQYFLGDRELSEEEREDLELSTMACVQIDIRETCSPLVASADGHDHEGGRSA